MWDDNEAQTWMDSMKASCYPKLDFMVCRNTQLGRGQISHVCLLSGLEEDKSGKLLAAKASSARCTCSFLCFQLVDDEIVWLGPRLRFLGFAEEAGASTCHLAPRPRLCCSAPGRKEPMSRLGDGLTLEDCAR